MKLFLICLALRFVSPDKLDHTYLPPPGAQLAGGSPGDILAPPEIQFGIDGGREPRPFGQSTVLPITTTSYAFTQTTTYPPIENYETTAAPTDLITRLPAQIIRKPGPKGSQNYPSFNQNQDLSTPLFDENNQRITAPPTFLSGDKYVNIGTPNYDQNGNQLQNQYTNQYPNNYGNDNFGNLSNNNYRSNQQEVLPSSPSSQERKSNRLPGTQYSQNGASDQIYSGQSVIKQESEQNHLINDKNPASDLNQIISEAFSEQTTYQPNQFYDGVISTTQETDFPSSSLTYSSLGSINRPQRPQAEADRNAVIINYENVRTPNGYSYSYDTSNGIHADENGIVEDGTRAQGSYSYVGDDGKIYSVFYTADENGFQPHGEHLPTAPPVPEAIQKVIDQAIRDKEAGIVDDGSYDEERYGYKKYVQPKIHQKPQMKNIIEQDNSLSDKSQRDRILPISGISDDDYDNDELPNRPHDVAISKNKVQPVYKQTLEYPVKTGEEYNKNIPGDNKQMLSDNENYSPFTELDNNKYVKTLTPNLEMNYKPYKNAQTKYPETQPEDIASHDGSKTGFFNYKDQALKDRTPESYSYKQPLIQGNIGKLRTPSQDENQQVDKNGYQYNPPENQFSQTEFPGRFKTQDISSTTKPVNGNIFTKQTTRRPFLTPEVYNQPSRSNDEEYQQSTTRRPLVTPEVNTRKTTSYNNYDDDDIDYNTGQKINDENISINKSSTSKFNIVTPSVPKLSTFSPPGTNANILEKETITPSYQSSTFAPNSPVTTSSRFNSKVTPQETNTLYQYGPASSTDISVPVNAEKYPESQKTSYKYQPNTATISMYPMAVSGTNQPIYGSPQNYQISTDKPVTSISTPGYQPKTGGMISPGTFENSPIGTYNTKNQYEPINRGFVTTKQPILRYTTTSIPDYQQTNFELNPTFSTSTTRRPDKFSTFILSGSDANAPKFSPIETSQTIYQYGLKNPSYSTAIKPQLPGSTKSDSENVGQPNRPKKPALGYIYEQPSTTTSSASTIDTTPGFIYSTSTARPFYFPSEDSNPQSLVDGLGRPILLNQQPEYPYSGQNPIENQATQFIDGQQSRRPDQPFNSNDFPGTKVSYMKHNTQPNIIGEDFSGPKQPQTFNPETGYHY